MGEYRGRTFHGHTIDLDGHTFINCTFKGCTLRYSGGALPELQSSQVQASEIQLAGSAGLTLEFLRAICANGGTAPIQGFLDYVLGKSDPHAPPVH